MVADHTLFNRKQHLPMPVAQDTDIHGWSTGVSIRAAGLSIALQPEISELHNQYTPLSKPHTTKYKCEDKGTIAFATCYVPR